MAILGSLRGRFFVWVGLPAIAFIGLVFGSVDLVPAWQAKSGDGVVGTFTAEREDCGRRSCSFHGDWIAADGSATRGDVILYDEPDSLRVGGTTEAVDTGARKGVFATAGGVTYLMVTGFTLGGVAAAVGFVIVLVRTVRRRQESATPGAGRPEAVHPA